MSALPPACLVTVSLREAVEVVLRMRETQPEYVRVIAAQNRALREARAGRQS